MSPNSIKRTIPLGKALILVDQYLSYLKRTGTSKRNFAQYARIGTNWDSEVEKHRGMSEYRYNQVKAVFRKYPEGITPEHQSIKQWTQDQIREAVERREQRRFAMVQELLDKEAAPANYFGSRVPVERMVA